MISNEKMLALYKSGKFEELENSLQLNMIEELNKKAGRKSSDSTIIKRILKSKKENRRFGMCHPFTRNGVEYYGLLDGYRILAAADTMGVEVATGEDSYNLSRCIVPDSELTQSISLDLRKIKYFNGIVKSKKDVTPYIVKCGESYIAFNPSYLADAIEFTGTSVVRFQKITGGALKSPMMLENVDTCRLAMVLPVSISENIEIDFDNQQKILKDGGLL